MFIFGDTGIRLHLLKLISVFKYSGYWNSWFPIRDSKFNAEFLLLNSSKQVSIGNRKRRRRRREKKKSCTNIRLFCSKVWDTVTC